MDENTVRELRESRDLDDKRLRELIVSGEFDDELRLNADEVSVSINADTESVKHFALSYAAEAVILQPKQLADEVKAQLAEALERYGDE